MRIIPWDEINGERNEEQKIKAFLTKETDTFAILQLKEIDGIINNLPEDAKPEAFEMWNSRTRRQRTSQQAYRAGCPFCLPPRGVPGIRNTPLHGKMWRQYWRLNL